MRTLSAALTAELAKKAAPSALLLDLDVGGSLHHWADRTIVFGGNSYEPRLAMDDAVRQRRSLTLDSAQVVVENVTREISETLKSEFMQGASATLRRLYLRAGEAVAVFSGLVAEVELDQQSARLRLVNKLDPAARRIPVRVYSQLCTWRYKGPECGSVSALQSCNKTFADCTTRLVTHRFNGFVHITRELEETVAAPPPPAEIDPEEDFLEEYYGEGWL